VTQRLQALLSFDTTVRASSTTTVRRTRSTRPRDSQKSKVYAAELRRGDEFASVAEMQAYVDRLHASAWFKRRWPRLRGFVVHSGAGNRRATCSWGLCPTLKMPKWARVESVLLHEVAHACTFERYAKTVAAHGPEFVATYLELLRHQMGDEVWREQKAKFVERKVRHRLPSKTKRTLTPEQKAAAAERLVAARAARGRS
jgi:putative metallohydrolase (TIGR04338 family)